MQLLLKILASVAFVTAIVVAPIAWFRMVRAQSRAAYWKNMALFGGPILLFFLLAKGAGLLPEMPAPPPSPPSAQDILGRMPTEQLILLGAAALLWIGGGNILFLLHNRRLGKKWWQALNPLDPPFKDFNSREWLILGALVVGSMGLGMFAISLGHAA